MKVLLAFAWHEPGHMEGIYRYARKAGWILSRWQPGQPSPMRGFAPHGILCQLHSSVPDMLEGVRAAGIPCVSLVEDGSHAYPVVGSDNAAEGRLAAGHLLERGFTHLVYMGGFNDCHKGFRDAARKAGVQLTEADLASSAVRHATGEDRPHSGIIHDECSLLRRKWAVDFLAPLPKPVGVFCDYLIWASDIIEGCVEADILVPEHVAVVTAVDVPSEGEACAVPATVVAPDYQTQAYQAAQMLDQMMRGQRIAPKTVVRVPPLPVVVRDSTQVRAVANTDVARAVACIMRSFRDGNLSAKQVVREIGVSRRTLYREFIRHLGEPIAKYIERIRLKEATALLETTMLTAGAIAEQCGFSDLRRFCRVLKRVTGMAPRAYRATNMQ